MHSKKQNKLLTGKKQNMKKIIAIFLMIVLSCSMFTACTTQRQSTGCSATRGKVGY